MFGNPQTSCRNDLFSRHFVWTLRIATAAEQALTEVLKDFLLKANFAIKHRLREGDLTASNATLTIFSAKHRAMRPSGTALDALFNLFSKIFKLFQLGHILNRCQGQGAGVRKSEV